MGYHTFKIFGHKNLPINLQNSIETFCCQLYLLFLNRIYKLQKQPSEVFFKKSVLKISQNLQENTCARVSSIIKLQAIKGTLGQVFSCEFYDFFKSTFFIEHLYSFRDMVAQREDGFSNTELYRQFYYFGLLNYLLLFNFICCQ